MGNPHVCGPLGAAAAFLVLNGLCVSCSAVGGASAGHAPAIQAAASIQVTDNFNANELEKQFQEVSARVAPAVVAISATDAQVSRSDFKCDDINGDRLVAMLSSVDRTVGTGFVVDSDGYVLTNDHVVTHAEQLWVTMDDHRVYPAIVVGSDPRGDVALLKVPATGLPVVQLKDSSAVKRGQWTLALGNPFGMSSGGEMCVSVGIVSALDRSLPRLSDKEDRLYTGLIQTTAQINPGNSGGPLFDISGHVVGINTAVILPQKQTNGIGFAIPVTHHLIEEVQNLKQGREVVYGYLGVRVSSPTPHEIRDAGLEYAAGARIDFVDDGSPAVGHLTPGDIITRFNDEDVQNGDQFVRLVGDAPVGQPVPMTIHRGSRTETAEVNLRPRRETAASNLHDKPRLHWRGLLLGPIPSNWDFGPEKRPASGVMVLGIDSRSPFQKDRLRQGAVITAIDGKAVDDVVEAQRVIADVVAEKSILTVAATPAQVVAAD